MSTRQAKKPIPKMQNGKSKPSSLKTVTEADLTLAKQGLKQRMKVLAATDAILVKLTVVAEQAQHTLDLLSGKVTTGFLTLTNSSEATKEQVE